MRFFARWLGQNFEARFEGIVRFDQLKLGTAAAEKRLEQFLEVLVDLVERLEQPFASFAVESGNALAQAPNRLDQILALAGEARDFALEVLGLFLGAQIDTTQTLSFRP